MKWVVALLAVAGMVQAQDTTNVILLTRDRVEIVATYYPANAKSAPVVLLLHDAQRSRVIWTPFAQLLQRNGIATCAIDLRGHGESIRRLGADGPQRLDAQSFADRDYQDMLLDVNAAYDWLAEQPEIDAKRIAVMGSSLGANVALRYVTFNADIAALVLVSPTLNDHGLKAEEALDDIRQLPLRIVVARQDNITFESAKKLIELRGESGRGELIACSGWQRGSDLLRGVEGLPQMLLEWLKQVLATP